MHRHAGLRYARIPSKPEHILLRDAAVAHIGNPWLKKSVWDAFVLDERGNPDDAAREMVYGWLKRRLISDFFELMSADGSGDTRRLNYWLRFEPFVEDMWFALVQPHASTTVRDSGLQDACSGKITQP
jgi:hypothetical protein